MSASWDVEIRVKVTFEREGLEDDADVSPGEASALERAVIVAANGIDVDEVDGWVVDDLEVEV